MRSTSLPQYRNCQYKWHPEPGPPLQYMNVLSSINGMSTTTPRERTCHSPARQWRPKWSAGDLGFQLSRLASEYWFRQPWLVSMCIGCQWVPAPLLLLHYICTIHCLQSRLLTYININSPIWCKDTSNQNDESIIIIENISNSKHVATAIYTVIFWYHLIVLVWLDS